MIYITRRRVLSDRPCQRLYKKALKQMGGTKQCPLDQPLSLLKILDKCGIDAAEWVIFNLFPAPLRAEYERQVAPLWEEYERQVAPLREEYERQESLLRAEYERQVAPLLEKYERQVADLIRRILEKEEENDAN